ncbi:AmmeMemoRadiSam system protein A [Nitratidesulfovibrio liaohensis]|uniref:AmmeMemoRadiSam system protein A n=1 Tax=Nitratidesulfovibrio liaohensis TaxID=2604158 RepID=UPI001423C32F|nr:AmmeMemoRadiSam system protein A [Nitratidesulfovibrio liaohensis]NHZ45701.1 AmmeMemoRadiSam system protein A [Nitratidesulfovibrio liaohensis]
MSTPLTHVTDAGDAAGADSGAFRLELAADERTWLLDLARWAVLHRLAEAGATQGGATGADGPTGSGGPDASEVPAPPPGVLHRSLGAFVTFKKDGHLRGCIGSMVGDGPLYLTVARMARAAAFEDPRFPPVTAAEAPSLELDISVLGPLTRCPDPSLVRVGRHGLLVRQGYRSGVLLPQVPVEWGWDRETFLAQTCRKAGLPSDAWRDAWQDGRTELYWFEAEVFGDL